MSAIALFNFQGQEVRFVGVLDEVVYPHASEQRSLEVFMSTEDAEEMDIDFDLPPEDIEGEDAEEMDIDFDDLDLSDPEEPEPYEPAKPGFFPISLSFHPRVWNDIQGIPKVLWMRELPRLGDWIIFKANGQHYRGKVYEKAFAALDSEQAEEAISRPSIPTVYLYILSIERCNDPARSSVW